MTPRKLKPPSESHEMKCLARYLDARGFLWLHVPNEGKRDPRYAARLKAEGVKAGVPDVLIFKPCYGGIPVRTQCGLAIELKALDGDKPTDAQFEWLAKLNLAGWECGWCRGHVKAIEMVERVYGKR